MLDTYAVRIVHSRTHDCRKGMLSVFCLLAVDVTTKGAYVHEGSPSIRHCLRYDNYTECLLFRNGVTGLDVREAGHGMQT